MPNSPILMDFLLFDGFSNLVLASGLEPLRAANGIAGRKLYEWRLLSINGPSATSSSGITMSAECAHSVAEVPSRLFSVAGFGIRDHVTAETLSVLRNSGRNGVALGGIDMGAWLLGAAGALDGFKATVHWQELGEFAEEFPNVNVVDHRYVIDGPRISAGGATAAMELMIALIRADFGSALAFEVTNMFVYDAEASRRGGRGAIHVGISNRSPQVIRAIDGMRANVEEPVSLQEIARMASCSQRTLTRLFLRDLDLPPGRFYNSIRMSVARRLVEETRLPCTEIAAKTGFSSSAALARAYTNQFGATISVHRAGRLN